jgi:hypothetical protein
MPGDRMTAQRSIRLPASDIGGREGITNGRPG